MLKNLSNLGEKKVYGEIIGATQSYAGKIYEKVRIADAVDISCLPMELRQFALMSHLDFCIADETGYPVLVIEYDGGGHDQKNDYKKNRIIKLADLTFFRVNEEAVDIRTARMTLLEYLVHTYFMGVCFIEAQKKGEISYDEPFIMGAFLKPTAKHLFDSDFEFTIGPKSRCISNLRRHGYNEVNSYDFNMLVVGLYGDEDEWVTYTSVEVGDRYVYGKGRLRLCTPNLGRISEIPFGYSALGDFCEGLALENLNEELEAFFSGGGHTIQEPSDVRTEIEVLHARGFKMLRGGAGADTMLSSFWGKLN
ncbi:DUF2726 domain-containing protein [Sphingomicrobium arenosum]|uniref:DUF2726 domain-containing protein n=1 Tax=Sphingomicrobium arenosum TaxID=2233861 RepID=UPI002240BE9F|nr:DUF2726 domain-containing protein [Sphingomicrobium arenosum]